MYENLLRYIYTLTLYVSNSKNKKQIENNF